MADGGTDRHEATKPGVSNNGSLGKSVMQHQHKAFIHSLTHFTRTHETQMVDRSKRHPARTYWVKERNKKAEATFLFFLVGIPCWYLSPFFHFLLFFSVSR